MYIMFLLLKTDSNYFFCDLIANIKNIIDVEKNIRDIDNIWFFVPITTIRPWINNNVKIEITNNDIKKLKPNISP